MRWRILALLFLARMALGLQFQALASVSDPLRDAFGFDHADLGLLIGLFMAPGLVLALPAGSWGRFLADRSLAVIGLGALTVGALLCGLADGGGMIAAGRVIAGIGFLLATLYGTKMVTEWFDGREIATAMSLFVMSWPFGIALGQIGHVWLAELQGWRAPFFATSLYGAVMALALALVYRPPPGRTQSGLTQTRRLTKTEWRGIMLAGAAWGSFNAGYILFLSFGAPVLQAFGQSAGTASATLSLASWIMIVSGALCGQIVDRFDARDRVVALAMTGAIVGLALLGLPGWGLTGSLLFGLIGMAPAGVLMAMAGRVLRAEVRAFGMGVFFTIYHAFVMAVPPIGGALLDATGSVMGPIWLAMVLFALVVPLSRACARRAGRAVPTPVVPQARQPHA